MGAVRWPCNKQHPRGTERLYEDLKFWTGIDECQTYGVDFLTGNPTTRGEYARIDPKGKAFLRPVRARPQPNPKSDDYPFVLITDRVVYHFHTRTKTGRFEVLNRRAPHPRQPEPWLLARLAELNGESTTPFAARDFGSG
jgi:anaerobic selenocysteine-containing dehydrogenase